MSFGIKFPGYSNMGGEGVRWKILSNFVFNVTYRDVMLFCVYSTLLSTNFSSHIEKTLYLEHHVREIHNKNDKLTG